MKKFAVLMLLSACAPAPPNHPMPVITLSSGGFMGQSTTLIRSDDLVADHYVDMGVPDRQRSLPGAYARALAVIKAEGPATAAKVPPDGKVCMDYGTDVVRIEPQLADFAIVTSACPNDALQAFMTGLRTAVGP